MFSFNYENSGNNIIEKGGILIKRILNSIILFFFCFFVIALAFPNNTKAVTNYSTVGTVILGGDTIGLQIQTPVEVVGKYEVPNVNSKQSPWKSSNIEKGDYIYSINNVIISSSAEVTDVINNLEVGEIPINLIRKDKYITTAIKIVNNINGKKTIGLYIKDKITGVGTLTFVNSETSIYGALGHNVNSALSTGKLYNSSVQGIKKAEAGVPGEKYATLSNSTIGTIFSNMDIGIFGIMENNDTISKTIDILSASEVKVGKAQIITVVSGNTKKTFDIEIVDVKKQNNTDIKGIKFKVMDKGLIEQTGGIIQGMSGSPIIQNGYLVGAVSHVTVNDPLYGYGVFAEWMYYETL